jgi:CRP-like cAMP-binding protein
VPRKIRTFDVQGFLDSTRSAKSAVYRRGEVIFSQGDACRSVMYVRRGGVKLSVRSQAGREAVVAVVGPGDFFGEGGLAGQRVRAGNATALTPSTILVIDCREMARLLHTERALAARFIAHMLARNIGIEADLIDQLISSAEKRLALTLLRLARYGQRETRRRDVPKLSQDTLAEMAGTTRPHVDSLLNKFKRLGFIEDNGRLKINQSLLSVVLHE